MLLCQPPEALELVQGVLGPVGDAVRRVHATVPYQGKVPIFSLYSPSRLPTPKFGPISAVEVVGCQSIILGVMPIVAKLKSFDEESLVLIPERKFVLRKFQQMSLGHDFALDNKHRTRTYFI